jgi:entericidin B
MDRRSVESYVAARSAGSGLNLSTKGVIMWKKALFVLMSLMSLALTACNTVEGAGKDVSAAGRGMTEEAREHKTY